MIKQMRLPPRIKFYGIDHTKGVQYHMTGKEWHQYAKRQTLNYSRDGQFVWGSHLEIWLDREPLIDANFHFATGHAPGDAR